MDIKHQVNCTFSIDHILSMPKLPPAVLPLTQSTYNKHHILNEYLCSQTSNRFELKANDNLMMMGTRTFYIDNKLTQFDQSPFNLYNFSHLLNQKNSSISQVKSSNDRSKLKEALNDERERFENHQCNHQSERRKCSSYKNRNRNVRSIFTPSQRLALEKAFTESHYIEKTSRIELAKSIGLSEMQVRVWFQNRRTKLHSSKN